MHMNSSLKVGPITKPGQKEEHNGGGFCGPKNLDRTQGLYSLLNHHVANCKCTPVKIPQSRSKWVLTRETCYFFKGKVHLNTIKTEKRKKITGNKQQRLRVQIQGLKNKISKVIWRRKKYMRFSSSLAPSRVCVTSKGRSTLIWKRSMFKKLTPGICSTI
jgi:uncharacterized FlaG/YvyC family protein